MWERSFVAVSVLLGTPLDQTLAAVPNARDARLDELGLELRDSRRQVRAAALASVAQEVALAISEVTLR